MKAIALGVLKFGFRVGVAGLTSDLESGGKLRRKTNE